VKTNTSIQSATEQIDKARNKASRVLGVKVSRVQFLHLVDIITGESVEPTVKSVESQSSGTVQVKKTRAKYPTFARQQWDAMFDWNVLMNGAVHQIDLTTIPNTNWNRFVQKSWGMGKKNGLKAITRKTGAKSGTIQYVLREAQ